MAIIIISIIALILLILLIVFSKAILGQHNELKNIYNTFGISSFDEFSKLDFSSIKKDNLTPIELNKIANIGDKGILYANVTYGDIDEKFNIPIILKEKTKNSTKLNIILDKSRLLYLAPQQYNEDFIDFIEDTIKTMWFDSDVTKFSWFDENGIELTSEEIKDIKSFLKYTVIPEEKQIQIVKKLKI